MGSECIILYFTLTAKHIFEFKSKCTEACSKCALANNVLFCKCFHCNVNKQYLALKCMLGSYSGLNELFYEIFR